MFCGCNIFCVDFSLVIISSNCLSCPQDDLSSATLHLLRVDFGLILIFCELWKNCSDFFWFLNFDFCFSLELDSWSLIFYWFCALKFSKLFILNLVPKESSMLNINNKRSLLFKVLKKRLFINWLKIVLYIALNDCNYCRKFTQGVK